MTGSAKSETRLTDEFSMTRRRMIDRLRDENKITDERVLEAMENVPRHLFVPDALRFQAYRDNALPIEDKQTISQPAIVARMTSLLDVKPSDKVLEIGTGTGYQTAILALLGDKIYSIERMASLAAKAETRLREMGFRNVTVKEGDGTRGWEAYAPYDAILVTAGGPGAPEPLLGQLAPGGRLVIPVGDSLHKQELLLIKRTNEGFKRERHGACAFVPLIGDHGWQQ